MVRDPRTNPMPGDKLQGHDYVGKRQYRTVVKVTPGLRVFNATDVSYVTHDGWQRRCLIESWARWAESAKVVECAQ
jgi:hypothetical protein